MAKRKAATDDPTPADTTPDAAEATPELSGGTPALDPLVEIPIGEKLAAEIMADIGRGEPDNDRAKLDRLQKHQARIVEASDALKETFDAIISQRSRVDEEKSALKSLVESHERQANELTRVIDDASSGQQRLPFDDVADVVGRIEEGPISISEFAENRMHDLLGAEEMVRARGRDEPLGLTVKQLDKFASAGIATVQELEKRMTDHPHDWWTFLAGKADAAIVNRVLNSWREFRMKRPAGESKPKSIVERLAAKNDRTLLDRDQATSERIEPITIAETEDLYVQISTSRTVDGKWLTEFEAITPNGLEMRDHDIVVAPRVSESEAVQARLGALIARWGGMTFDADEWGLEHAAIVSRMRDWLNALAAGQSIDDVEAEMVEREALA